MKLFVKYDITKNNKYTINVLKINNKIHKLQIIIITIEENEEQQLFL